MIIPSFIPQGTQVSRRNGAFIPMVELLLYTTLSCPDADAIMLRIQAHDNLPEAVRVELVETVRESTPHCYWDAND